MSINAKVKNTNHFGSLSWDANNFQIMNLDDVPKSALIKNGDTIQTGGMSSIFPEDIPIGTIIEYSLLCFLALIWSSAFFNIKIATESFGPVTIAFLRVFFGAIPGALPFMLGWVAATNSFGIEPGTLFMIQFFWQFPHFWALGWMLDDDYKKAGFNMLPTGKKDKKTAIQIILYIIWMIIISIFPYSGLTGSLSLSIYGAIIVLVLGILMLMFAVNLYNRMNTESARRLFLFTIFYLTSIQLVYIFDKFI